MKKMFGKKDKGDGGAGAANSNPYATNGGSSDPYAQAPPSYPGSSASVSSLRPDKSPAFTSQGNDRYAAGGGYGSNAYSGGNTRYGAGADDAGAPQQSRYGTGGYGGFGGPPGGNRYVGGADPAPPAGANRFGAGAGAGAGPVPSLANGDAGNRYGGPAGVGLPSGGPGGNRYGGNTYGAVQQEQDGQPQSTWESGRGPGEEQSYGAYQDRELTAEEQEEEDIQGVKDEIRNIKQQDVSSTRNALRIAQMAEESGRNTLERLQQQGERIHNTERNLDLASNQNRLAAEKAREIKTLNRSMFAVHVKNPFGSGKRVAAREEAVLDQARADRAKRDATRAEAWSSEDRRARQNMELNRAGQNKGAGKSSLAERAKYQFEADSEDEAMEDEIDQNLDLLAGAAGRMKLVAGAMGQEIESQNRHIDRIGGKVDRVDDEIALNRSRLDRIK